MFKSLRVPEKLFKLVMWVVSFVFAGFLTGLGGNIVADLPRLETRIEVEQFADADALAKTRASLQALALDLRTLDDQHEQVQLAAQVAGNAYSSARGAFDNWLSTRSVTTNPAQDTELTNRTKQLDTLKSRERQAQIDVESVDKRALDARQQEQRLHEAEASLLTSAQSAYDAAVFKQEMRVFGTRLLVALPLLGIAGWMIARKRRSEYWPLMRGFVLFAVFTFFVELVPYLPSYGGYVRYGVGIVLTVIAGHYVVKSMRAYLARRQAVEQQSEESRRQALSYEDALKKMASNVCPGCERAVQANGNVPGNFCVHCGMTLFENCRRCTTRHNAFFRFCPTCGTSGKDAEAADGSKPAPLAPTVAPA